MFSRYSTPLLLIGMLGSISSAQEGDAAAAMSDIIVYLTNLAAEPEFTSVAEVLATETEAVSSLESIQSQFNEGSSVDITEALSALPTEVRPFYESVYSAESSILVANGFSPDDANSDVGNLLDDAQSDVVASMTDRLGNGSSTPTPTSQTNGQDSDDEDGDDEADNDVDSAAGANFVPFFGLAAAACSGLLAAMIAL